MFIKINIIVELFYVAILSLIPMHGIAGNPFDRTGEITIERREWGFLHNRTRLRESEDIAIGKNGEVFFAGNKNAYMLDTKGDLIRLSDHFALGWSKSSVTNVCSVSHTSGGPLIKWVTTDKHGNAYFLTHRAIYIVETDSEQNISIGSIDLIPLLPILSSVYDIAVDHLGYIYLAQLNHSFSTKYEVVKIKPGEKPKVVMPSQISPNCPFSLTVDSMRNLYVAGDDSNVKKISRHGSIINIIDRHGDGSKLPCSFSKFRGPVSISISGDNIYIAGTRSAYRINSDGTKRKIFQCTESYKSCYGGDKKLKLDVFEDIESDALGNAYIKTYSGKLYKVNMENNVEQMCLEDKNNWSLSYLLSDYNGNAYAVFDKEGAIKIRRLTSTLK